MQQHANRIIDYKPAWGAERRSFCLNTANNMQQKRQQSQQQELDVPRQQQQTPTTVRNNKGTSRFF